MMKKILSNEYQFASILMLVLSLSIKLYYKIASIVKNKFVFDFSVDYIYSSLAFIGIVFFIIHCLTSYQIGKTTLFIALQNLTMSISGLIKIIILVINGTKTQWLASLVVLAFPIFITIDCFRGFKLIKITYLLYLLLVIFTFVGWIGGFLTEQNIHALLKNSGGLLLVLSEYTYILYRKNATLKKASNKDKYAYRRR